MLAEQRMMFEEEKEAALNELREQLRLEKDQEVTETKKKQWASTIHSCRVCFDCCVVLSRLVSSYFVHWLYSFAWCFMIASVM
jgi:hypothetical protein